MSYQRILSAVVWLPWAVLAVGIPITLYWLLEPVPLTVVAVAQNFVDREAESMADAERHAVTETVGGVTLFRYVEYCVSRPFQGHANKAWVTPAFIWHVPNGDVYYSRRVGCFHLNIAVEVPTSNPTRSFEFRQTIDVETNPLRTDRVAYEPIRLKVLASPKEESCSSNTSSQ